MTLSVFVATMRMEGDGLLRRMGLRGDGCAVINQCGREGAREARTEECRATVYDSAEKGLARSRNRALGLARGDLLWMCDDDMRLLDGYEAKILAAFADMPEADAIAFNVTSETPDRPQPPIREAHRVAIQNALRYPTYRFVYRLSSLRAKDLSFPERFGSGARYSSGEDSIFTVSCLRAGLKLWAVPVEIARVNHADSAWFGGFDEKFLFDKGALFRAMFGRRAPIYCAAMLLRRPEWRGGKPLFAAYAAMLRGGRDFAAAKGE